jgi:hypothetical protein
VAAAISSGWLAFVLGIVIAIVLVAFVGRLSSEHRGARHT